MDYGPATTPEVKQMNIGHGFRFEHRGSLNLLGELPTIKNHTVPP